jgi:hypothetical protein
LLSLAVGLGYGIPVLVRMHTVVTTANVAKHNAASNRLWHMVAYGDTDDTPLGQLAQRVRVLTDKANNPNPIRALRVYQVKPNEFPGVKASLLGEDPFYVKGNNGIDATQGFFTDEFILAALQATPETVADITQPVPVVPSYGYLRWQWLAAGLAVIWVLYGLAWWALRRDRRAYQQRPVTLRAVEPYESTAPPPDTA